MHKDLDYGLLVGLGSNYNLPHASITVEARFYRALSHLFVPNEEFSVAAHQVFEFSLTYFFLVKSFKGSRTTNAEERD